MSFLSHTISSFGIRPSPYKVKAVTSDWKRPQTVTQVRSFLGFSSYYIHYIRNFSVYAAPLNRLLEAGHAFIWTYDCETAFQDLKSALTGEEVMAFPQDSGLFSLDTGASDFGIGAVLSQVQFCLCLGRAMVYDCDTPWTFLLPFFVKRLEKKLKDLFPLLASL